MVMRNAPAVNSPTSPSRRSTIGGRVLLTFRSPAVLAARHLPALLLSREADRHSVREERRPHAARYRSGPVCATEEFVSPRFDIVAQTSVNSTIPRSSGCTRAKPLPSRTRPSMLPSRSRCWSTCRRAAAGLIREMQRVSRQAAIVCCPLTRRRSLTPSVGSRMGQAVSGRDVGFLVESLRTWSARSSGGRVLVQRAGVCADRR